MCMYFVLIEGQKPFICICFLLNASPIDKCMGFMKQAEIRLARYFLTNAS